MANVLQEQQGQGQWLNRQACAGEKLWSWKNLEVRSLNSTLVLHRKKQSFRVPLLATVSLSLGSHSDTSSALFCLIITATPSSFKCITEFHFVSKTLLILFNCKFGLWYIKASFQVTHTSSPISNHLWLLKS